MMIYDHAAASGASIRAAAGSPVQASSDCSWLEYQWVSSIDSQKYFREIREEPYTTPNFVIQVEY
jgi:hypothetical protein